MNFNQMKKYQISIKMLLLVSCFLVLSPACTNLDEEIYSEVTAENFFQTEDELISALGAAYTSLYGFTGNWTSAQEVSSDEMVVPTRGPDWGDGGHWVRMHQHRWTSEDDIVNGAWNFLFSGVSACNRLIFQFEELGNPLTDPFIDELKALRAIYYLWLMDLYGNVPIVTKFADADPNPATNSRSEIFNFVETELKAALPSLSPNVDGTTYGRVNQMVAQMALAKLYLNAEIYTGAPRYQDAITACDAIINSGKFSLMVNYHDNFAVDNSGSTEFIFAIPYDAVFAGGFNLVMQTLSYINQQTYNLAAQPWNGWCTLETFYNSYADNDLRKGQANTETEDYAREPGNFLNGPQFGSDGSRLLDAGTTASGIDPDGEPFTYREHINELFPTAWRESGARVKKYQFEIGGQPDMNNDFPIYRYSDVLLMKAEALWRMSGNSTDPEALGLVNQIRERAGLLDLTTLDGCIAFKAFDPGYTYDPNDPSACGDPVPGGELYNERGREMFFESHRRTDMVRFGLYDDEWWAKPESPPHRSIFPIPRNQLDANTNLVQNPGY